MADREKCPKPKDDPFSEQEEINRIYRIRNRPIGNRKHREEKTPSWPPKISPVPFEDDELPF